MKVEVYLSLILVSVALAVVGSISESSAPTFHSWDFDIDDWPTDGILALRFGRVFVSLGSLAICGSLVFDEA